MSREARGDISPAPLCDHTDFLACPFRDCSPVLGKIGDKLLGIWMVSLQPGTAVLNLFETPVPFWVQGTQTPSNSSPNCPQNEAAVLKRVKQNNYMQLLILTVPSRVKHGVIYACRVRFFFFFPATWSSWHLPRRASRQIMYFEACLPRPFQHVLFFRQRA